MGTRNRLGWGKGFALLVLFGLLAAGCTDGEPAEAVNPVVSRTYKEKLVGIQQAATALEASGIKMSRSKQVNYYMLNKIFPIPFELPNNEKLYIYSYDSAKGTRLARNDFAEQTKLKDIRMPLFYDSKNILIVYEHNATGDQPEAKPVYQKAIEASIDSLLGDEVAFKLGAAYNVSKLDTFFEHVKAGKPDQLKVSSLTIEGDPIYKYASSNGTQLQVLLDDSLDAYAGEDKGVRQFQCVSLDKETVAAENGEHIRYVAKGCSGLNPEIFLATVRSDPAKQ